MDHWAGQAYVKVQGGEEANNACTYVRTYVSTYGHAHVEKLAIVALKEPLEKLARVAPRKPREKLANRALRKPLEKLAIVAPS